MSRNSDDEGLGTNLGFVPEDEHFLGFTDELEIVLSSSISGHNSNNGNGK